jgi:hypothetical protein
MGDRWEITKEWLEWTIRDELYYGLIRPLWGKAVIGMVAAIALAIFAYVKTHPALFNSAVGAVVACMVILGAHLIQTKFPRRPNAARPVPVLNEELIPTGKSISIQNPDDLAHYYARIVSLWGDVKQTAEEFQLIKEYVQGHWDELIANRRDRMRPWMERNFPDAVLTEEDITPLQEQMISAASAWRNVLQKLISLLHFKFEF